MFLGSGPAQSRTACTSCFLAAAFLTGGLTRAADLRPHCFLDIPLYDAAGNRLTVKILSVSIHDEAVDLLTNKSNEIHLKVEGGRLYFSENLIGKRPLDVTVAEDSGRRTKAPVVLTACQQRTSFERGARDTGADVGWSPVSGQISGCRVVGDWWIRAVPMFGGQEGPTAEGFINLADGRFLINCYQGVRQILVIGRGKRPLKVIGFDVTAGGTNDVGTVNLSGSCPSN